MALFEYDQEPGQSEAPAKTLPRRLWQLLRDECAALLRLNLLFCLFCLPVVTIPPAVFCLHKCCWQLIQNKPAGFFAAFRQALALAFLHPGRALAGAACHYGLPALAILLLPFSGAYLVLIGFSIPCLLGCLFAQKGLARVLGQEDGHV